VFSTTNSGWSWTRQTSFDAIDDDVAKILSSTMMNHDWIGCQVDVSVRFVVMHSWFVVVVVVDSSDFHYFVVLQALRVSSWANRFSCNRNFFDCGLFQGCRKAS
jgi:hypothetical protein